VVFAVLLGLLLGRHFGAPTAVVRPHPVAHQPIAERGKAPGNLPMDASAPRRREGTAAQQSAATRQSTTTQPVPVSATASAKGNEKSAPPGSLLVFENGKEIFRMPPQQSEAVGGETAPSETESSSPGEGSGQQFASSAERQKAVDVSSAKAEGSLLHRVEPTYPDDALRHKIQGPVVLEVHIGRDGAVQDVQFVSGPPELAQASTDAVKQWRFRPLQVNGSAVPMQTRITLNFSLPQ
jgi:TonB family protein